LALGGWTLWQAPSGNWWLLWPVALGISYAVWWRGSRTILERASRAANELELQWDDLLRYKQVREFTIGVAWGPAAVAGFLASIVENWMTAAFCVGLVVIAIQLTVFRDGRDLWRRPWMVASS
jgi:hypothetical protein